MTCLIVFPASRKFFFLVCGIREEELGSSHNGKKTGFPNKQVFPECVAQNNAKPLIYLTGQYIFFQMFIVSKSTAFPGEQEYRQNALCFSFTYCSMGQESSLWPHWLSFLSCISGAEACRSKTLSIKE